MPLSFDEIDVARQRLAPYHPEVGGMSVPEFSRWMNETTGTEDYAAGMKPPSTFGSLIKKGSRAIDVGLEATGLPQASSEFFGGLGELVSPEMKAAGERAGRGLPRMAVNFAPLIAAEVASGGTATPGILPLLGTMGLTGSEVYTETGSPLAGVIGAATIPAMGVGGRLGQSAITRLLPEAGRIAQYGAQQVGALGAADVIGEAQSKATGHGFYNPLSPERLFETGINVLPFAAMHLPDLFRQQQVAERATKGLDPIIADENDRRFMMAGIDMPPQRVYPTDLPSSDRLQLTFPENRLTFPPALQQLGYPPEPLALPAPTLPELPRTPRVPTERIPAGVGLHYGIGDIVSINDTGNLTLGKRALPRDGLIDEKQFRSAAQALPSGEIELYKMLVPEAFTQGRVNIPQLVEGLKTKGPVVEVRKLGARGGTGQQAQHELETLGYSVDFDAMAGYHLIRNDTIIVPVNEVSSRVKELFETYQRAAEAEQPGSYASVAPKPESEMPGYVEGLVRIPAAGGYEGRRDARPGQYVGPHFGGEDVNVLAFFRGYEETLPDGTKAFHVIEVQSDWGQKQQGMLEGRKQAVREIGKFVYKDDNTWHYDGGTRSYTFEGGTKEQATEHFTDQIYKEIPAIDASGHPLLHVYETLALKAVIAHAKEIGATKVILSDAETAMMTEGHDRAGNVRYLPQTDAPQVKGKIVDAADTQTRTTLTGKVKIDEQGFGVAFQDVDGVWHHQDDLPADLSDSLKKENYVSQEQGMRLHYDQTLPSAMEKLTGEKGQTIELGEHKNALVPAAMGQMEGGETVGSPVFRDASGNPKTQITGRMYDLGKIKDVESFPLMQSWTPKTLLGKPIQQTVVTPTAERPVILPEEPRIMGVTSKEEFTKNLVTQQLIAHMRGTDAPITTDQTLQKSIDEFLKQPDVTTDEATGRALQQQLNKTSRSILDQEQAAGEATKAPDLSTLNDEQARIVADIVRQRSTIAQQGGYDYVTDFVYRKATEAATRFTSPEEFRNYLEGEATKAQTLQGRRREAVHERIEGIRLQDLPTYESVEDSAGRDAIVDTLKARFDGALARLQQLDPEQLTAIFGDARSGLIRSRIVLDELQRNGQDGLGTRVAQRLLDWEQIHPEDAGVAWRGETPEKNVTNFVRDKLPQLFATLEDHGLDVSFMGAKAAPLGRMLGEAFTKPGTRQAYLTTLNEVLSRYYENQGLSKQEVEDKVDFNLKIAALFPQLERTRVTNIFGENEARLIYGASFGSTDPRMTGLIGYALDKISDVGTKSRFFLNFVIGHEQHHSLEKAFEAGRLSEFDSQKIRNLIDGAKQFDTGTRMSILSSIYNELVPRELQDAKALDLILKGGADDEEFRASLGGLLAYGMAGRNEFKPGGGMYRDILAFLPKVVSDYFRVMAKHVSFVLDGLGFAKTAKDFNIADSNAGGEASRYVEQFRDTYDELARSAEHVDKIVDQFRTMANRNLQGMYGLEVLLNHTNPININDIFDGKGDIKFLADEASKQMFGEGRKLGIVGRNLVPFFQLSEANPLLKGIAKAILDHRGLINTANTAKYATLMGRTVRGRVVEDGKAEAVQRVVVSDKLRDYLTLLSNRQQSKEDFLTPEETADILKGLSEQDSNDVQTVFNGLLQMTQQSAEQRIRADQGFIGLTAANLIQRKEPQRRAIDTERLGEQLTQMLAVPAEQREAAAANVRANFTNILAPETLDGVVGLITTLQENADRTAGLLRSRGWYLSERRLGKYFLRWTTKDGKPGGLGFDSMEELNKKRAILEADGNRIEQVIEKERAGYGRFGLREDVAARLQEMDQAAFSRLRDIIGDEDFREIAKYFQPGEGIMKEMAAGDLLNVRVKRMLAEGRDELPMYDVAINYNAGISRAIANRQLKARMSLYRLDPDLQKRPDLIDLSDQQITNILAPDSKMGQVLRQAAFINFLGFRLSTGMIELMQPLMSFVPGMIHEGDGIVSAYKRTFKASNLVKSLFLSDKKSTGNEEFDEVLTRGILDRVIEQGGALADIGSDKDLLVVNARRGMDGKGPLDVGQYIKRPLSLFSSAVTDFYKLFVEHNNRVALLASYDYFRNEKGLPRNEAYDEARRVVTYTMFGGGKSSRPVGWFAGRNANGETTTAAQALMSLQQYNLSMTAMLGRYAREALGKRELEGDSLTNARKAAALMIGTQLTLAGVLGLPGVGAAVAILEQLFPNLQLHRKLRETFASLAGDDAEMGSIISDIAQSGVFSQTPVDAGSRFSLGNILGTNAYQGFEPTAALGPVGSMLTSWAKGVQQASMGNVGQGLETAAPLFIKNLLRLYNQDGQVRDAGGRLLYTPDDTQKFLLAIGFTPTQSTKAREQAQLTKRAADVEQADLKQFHQDLAARYTQGDLLGVRQAILERSKQDSSYDVKSGIERVANIVENRTLPVDPRREGSLRSVQDSAEIGRSFGLTAAPPSEVRRLQIRKGVAARLGLGASQGSQAEFQKAALVDYLMQTNPLLPRAAAVRMAEDRLRQSLPTHPAYEPPAAALLGL